MPKLRIRTKIFSSHDGVWVPVAYVERQTPEGWVRHSYPSEVGVGFYTPEFVRLERRRVAQKLRRKLQKQGLWER